MRSNLIKKSIIIKTIKKCIIIRMHINQNWTVEDFTAYLQVFWTNESKSSEDLSMLTQIGEVKTQKVAKH